MYNNGRKSIDCKRKFGVVWCGLLWCGVLWWCIWYCVVAFYDMTCVFAILCYMLCCPVMCCYVLLCAIIWCSQWRRQRGARGLSPPPNELKDHPCEKIKSEEKLRGGWWLCVILKSKIFFCKISPAKCRKSHLWYSRLQNFPGEHTLGPP